ncbi:MAG: hypothetical protein CVV03_07650 [Firmicutes bacterium HGW-Firmicutes-8]|nr:MAG: hypothetical protein CVV03_07650 [Firmicutes bacterium HGW-Firmicutes-8]
MWPAAGSKIANDVSARETLIKYPTPPASQYRPPEYTNPSCALAVEANRRLYPIIPVRTGQEAGFASGRQPLNLRD